MTFDLDKLLSHKKLALLSSESGQGMVWFAISLGISAAVGLFFWFFLGGGVLGLIFGGSIFLIFAIQIVLINGNFLLVYLGKKLRNVPFFLEILKNKNKNSEVRAYAVNALVEINLLTSDVVSVIINALEDRDEAYEVRLSAARALGRIGPVTPDVVPSLLKALRDEFLFSPARFAIAESLGKIGRVIPDIVVPVLIETLKGEYSNARSSAAEALGQIGDTSAVPALINVLRDEDRDVRSAAVRVLGKIGDLRALVALRELLSYTSPEIEISETEWVKVPMDFSYYEEAVESWRIGPNPEYEAIEEAIASIEANLREKGAPIPSLGALGFWPRLGLTDLRWIGFAEGMVIAGIELLLLFGLMPNAPPSYILSILIPSLLGISLVLFGASALLHKHFGVLQPDLTTRKDWKSVILASLIASSSLLAAPLMFGFMSIGVPLVLSAILGIVSGATLHAVLNSRQLSNGAKAVSTITPPAQVGNVEQMRPIYVEREVDFGEIIRRQGDVLALYSTEEELVELYELLMEKGKVVGVGLEIDLRGASVDRIRVYDENVKCIDLKRRFGAITLFMPPPQDVIKHELDPTSSPEALIEIIDKHSADNGIVVLVIHTKPEALLALEEGLGKGGFKYKYVLKEEQLKNLPLTPWMEAAKREKEQGMSPPSHYIIYSKNALSLIHTASSDRTISADGTVSAIHGAWEYIKKSIEEYDKAVAAKKEAFLSRLYHALSRTFENITNKTRAGRIDPFVKINLMKFSAEIDDPRLHEAEREVRVGFFPIAGNPMNWGHILPPVMAVNALELDTVVIRVQGEITYKGLLPSERVPVKDRHFMVKEAIKGLFPLFRYTDLGSEENNECEGPEELQRFLALNAQRKMHIFYLLGAESEERMWNYMRQQYAMFKKYNFGSNPNHKITFAVIQRGAYGATMTLEELHGIARKVQAEFGSALPLDIAVIKDPDIDLNVSSTYYRNTQDPAFVPPIAHNFAKTHGYWGHPPIDPRTGQPVTDSQEEWFRMRLKPVAREIAEDINTKIEQGVPGNTALISIDGGSGSGKTTIAEEVSKYLSEEHGLECVVIGTDLALKNREWRIAIEKLVIGMKLSEKEEALVGDLKNQIKPREPYLDEEEMFFDNPKALGLVKEVDEWRRSDSQSHDLTVPDAYIRGEAERKAAKFPLKKGMVIIFDGKYANREELQGYYDLRYRLHDAPDRTAARFEIRSRSLNPNDADMHIVFYKMSMVPCYELYDTRTEGQIHGFIDLRGEDWYMKRASYAVSQSLAASPFKGRLAILNWPLRILLFEQLLIHEGLHYLLAKLLGRETTGLILERERLGIGIRYHSPPELKDKLIQKIPPIANILIGIITLALFLILPDKTSYLSVIYIVVSIRALYTGLREFTKKDELRLFRPTIKSAERVKEVAERVLEIASRLTTDDPALKNALKAVSNRAATIREYGAIEIMSEYDIYENGHILAHTQGKGPASKEYSTLRVIFSEKVKGVLTVEKLVGNIVNTLVQRSGFDLPLEREKSLKDYLNREILEQL